MHRRRDPLWRPDPIKDTQWVAWDYALADAVNAVDMLTNSQTGQYRWLSEDPDVYWEVHESVDYGVQTLSEEAQKYKDGMPPELTLTLKNPVKTTGEFWTIDEWLAHAESSEARLDRDAPEGAHPPTPEEADAMHRARMERLKAALGEDAEDTPLD